jgi:hypothetical protein
MTCGVGMREHHRATLSRCLFTSGRCCQLRTDEYECCPQTSSKHVDLSPKRCSFQGPNRASGTLHTTHGFMALSCCTLQAERTNWGHGRRAGSWCAGAGAVLLLVQHTALSHVCCGDALEPLLALCRWRPHLHCAAARDASREYSQQGAAQPPRHAEGDHTACTSCHMHFMISLHSVARAVSFAR